MALWRLDLRRNIMEAGSGHSPFRLSAPNIAVGAHALLNFIRWNVTRQDPFSDRIAYDAVIAQDAPGAEIPPVPLSCLFRTDIPPWFQMCVQILYTHATSKILGVFSGDNSGEECIQSVVCAAIDITVADETIWADFGEWKALLLYPSVDHIPARRRDDLRTAGCLALVNLCFLSSGPDPISPFLLLMAMGGRKELVADIPFLKAVDPRTYERLGPWFERARSQPLGSDTTGLLSALFADAHLNVRDKKRQEARAHLSIVHRDGIPTAGLFRTIGTRTIADLWLMSGKRRLD